MKRIFAILLCGVLILSACAEKPGDEGETSATEPGISLYTEPTEESSETTPQTSAEPAISSYNEIPAAKIELEREEFESLIEAESASLSDGAQISDSREGYSGAGYVSSSPSGVVILEAEPLPRQHYNITIRAASDSKVGGRLYINGYPRGEFELSGSGEFEALRFDNILLGESAQIGISDLDGPADIDCVLIESSEEIYSLSYDPDEELSNPQADDSAKALYGYLLSCYGKKIISGQITSQGTDAEIESIFRETGRRPAIRFGELMDYSAGEDSGDIELAKKWAQSGGIVGYSWYWTINGSCYKEKSGFNLSNAVTDLDIAAMESEALALRYADGAVSAETLAIVDGIDKVAAKLLELKDIGAAVLFRPLPEAGSGMFWWSAEDESYLWLYNLIYERMTLYWGLNNIIWVWNGQSAELYPGDDRADIISLDIYYSEGSVLPSTSGVNMMLAARGISQNKMIAMSECSSLPSPDSALADNALWGFCSAGTGDYACGGKFMLPAEWVAFYNSETVVTLDEIEY